MLLVGAGLLVRSFQHAARRESGLRRAQSGDHLDPDAGVRRARRRSARRSTGRFATSCWRIPGVVNVGAVSRLPLMGKNLGSLAFIEGKSMPGQPGFDVEYRVATPSYFATMGIPLRAGRLFDDHDDANPAAVLLINETMARKFWPGENRGRASGSS